MALVPSPFTPGQLFGGPNDPFNTLRREMDRLFDSVLRGPSLSGMPQSERMVFAPSMEVTETEKELRVRAELPGVSEKDIELSLDGDVLTLRAEKKQERTEEREGVHFSERSYGTFQRSLRLPFQVQPEQVQARFENGVLTVTIPKREQKELSRRIQIQGSQATQENQLPGARPSDTGEANQRE